MKTEIRHLRDRDGVNAEMEGHDCDDLIAVDLVSGCVHRKYPVAVPVESDAEIEVAVANRLFQERKVGDTAACVDVRTVRLVAYDDNMGIEAPKRRWSDRVERSVGAIDSHAQV